MTPTIAHLEIDSETNGFKDPRIASISVALVCDWKPVHTFTALVRPEGWTMDPRATEVNGLTDGMLHALGLPLYMVLDMLDELLSVPVTPTIVCHNLNFDIERVILPEYKRAGRDSRIPRLPMFCTMQAMRPVCAIPMMANAPNGAIKSPNLSECYRHCFGKELENAHDASYDRWACGQIYRWLHDLDFRAYRFRGSSVNNCPHGKCYAPDYCKDFASCQSPAREISNRHIDPNAER